MDRFHSTVLRPPHEEGSNGAASAGDDRGPRGQLRDILNQNAATGPPAAPEPPRPQSSSFNLRSPTHHPPPFSASPSSSSINGSHSTPAAPRSILNNHFMPPSAGAPSSLTAPSLAAPSAVLPSAGPSGGAPGGLQAPPPHSPLHPPSVYYPKDIRPDRESTREKPAAGSFYDPTTDTTKERRVSDNGAWHNNNTTTSAAAPASTPKSREPYNYRSSDYYNGGYSSPVASTFPPRSPVSHSHPPPPAGSLSPSDRAVPISSSNARNAPMPGTNGATPAPGASSTTRTESPAPSSNPPAASTPSRAGVMSLSNMLSSSDPPSKPDMEAITPGPIKVRSDKAEKPEKADKLDKAEKPEKADKPDKSDKPGKPEKPEKPEKTPKAEKASKSDKTDKPEKPEKTPKAEKTAKSDNAEKPAADEIEKLETPAKEKKAPRRTAKSRASGIRNSESTPKPSSRRSSAKLETPTSTKAPLKRQVNGHPKHKTFSAEKERKIKELMDQFDSQAEDIGETDFDEELSAWKARSLRRRLEMENRDSSKHQVRRNDFTTHEMQKLKIHADLGKRRYDDLYYEEALREVRETELHLEKERKKDMQRKRRREKSMATTIAQENAARARALNAQDETERQKHLREAERASKKVQQTKLILEKGIKGPARNLGPIEPNLEGGTMATFQAENMEPGKSKGKNRTGARPKKSKEQKQAEKDNAEAAQAALDAGEELPSKEESSKIRIKLNKKGAKEDGDKENKEPKGKDKDAAEEPKDPLETKFQSKGFNQIYDQIWRDLARKDVSKVYRLATDSYATKGSNLKKTAILASKEAKRWQLRTNKGHKDLQARAKRVMRDMMGFWKRNEREERDLRKAAEKQELENARKEEADREAARQKRKLNFLISQTELYSHFIGKKIKTDEVERSTDHPDEAAKDKAEGKTEATNGLNVEEPSGPVGSKVTNFEDLDFDAEDESTLRAAAMANAQNAIAEAQQKARDFNKDANLDEDGEMNFQNPTGMGEVEIEQPKLLNCQLKEYQLKGLNWLANLYEQGINGILADEMGLGKTVQSISVMAYLAEKYDIWGPFLVVAPASTLHNWQQEITKFVPQFKVLPYWGTAADRKVLRKFWDRKHHTYKKEAAFHVMITSYQLVVSDVAYFQKMKWQYMILDEAQAIKSSQSSRWKCLLSFHCRNRLLLTGTPIQNNMQELWALLHFIMPSLFDSHDEFSEWFSKDIESHAQSNTKLNEDQLKRLHMILKPFMLRRVKKHVQKELGDKIELDVFCDLTYRQRALYSNLRNQISIMDLIEKATLGDDDSASLMNLVMQFRKVCNHPDLFERADIKSPFFTGYFAETGSFLREGNNIPVGYSTRSLIGYPLPRLVWREGGRLHLPGKDNQKAGFRNKHLDHMMNIWAPDNISESLGGQDNFSFLRFADTSPQEAYHVSHQDIFTRAVKLSQKKQRLANMSVVYDDPGSGTENWTPAHALLNVRERGNRKALADVTSEGILSNLMNVSRTSYEDTGVTRLEQAGCARALAAPIEVLCDSHATRAERDHVMFNPTIRKALFGPTPIEELALVTQKVPFERYPPPALLPPPDSENKRFNNITVPSMRRFVTDSGKLAKLDELLRTLKEGGHRVLLYFQMTRMIDLIEEYLTYRNYKYCRLDGSTKLEDRRDTVADFQTRPEIFIFLLSTRAGGLGINLTSADTVIFYDSDWNPTIDSQAMDRAHRLGQTRQVTVYRLITRGTIEERIRKRAMQKEEVQRVVIQGGGSSATGGGVDFSGRRPPENRSRDIAMWLADDEQAELIERREKELLESGEFDKAHKKRGGGKRKRADVSLDEMYHEGEGNFDDNKASGTATPVDEVRPGKKKRGPPGSKKAKTAKQRLAIADGEIDI